jgi:hypothetical protein
MNHLRRPSVADGVGDARGQSRTALASTAAAAFLVVLKFGAGLATGSLGLVLAGIESSGGWASDSRSASLTMERMKIRGVSMRTGVGAAICVGELAANSASLRVALSGTKSRTVLGGGAGAPC